MKQGETGRQIGWFISYDKDNPNMMMAINVKDVQDKGMASYNAKISGKVYDELYGTVKKYDIDDETVKQSVTMVASLFYYELLISAVTSPLNTISSFSLYVESDTVTSPFLWIFICNFSDNVQCITWVYRFNKFNVIHLCSCYNFFSVFSTHNLNDIESVCMPDAMIPLNLLCSAFSSICIY